MLKVCTFEQENKKSLHYISAKTHTHTQYFRNLNLKINHDVFNLQSTQ